MKIFISWSGTLSKGLAAIFQEWLPAVIQAVRPYYSPDDIAKGARWSSEVAKELNDSRVGLIFLTKENVLAPWLMFEAGALSKNIDKAKVCPILFGIEPAEVQGPLVQFQAARFEKDDIEKVIRMINSELADQGLSEDVLKSVYEMWWPKLLERVEKEMREQGQSKIAATRSDRELLEEILGLTRNILKRTPMPTSALWRKLNEARNPQLESPFPGSVALFGEDLQVLVPKEESKDESSSNPKPDSDKT